MKKEEIFYESNLPSGIKIAVLEGKGKHFFSASLKANGNSALVIQYLLAELVLIDGKKQSFEFYEEMSLKDINFIYEVINTMMADNSEINN